MTNPDEKNDDLEKRYQEALEAERERQRRDMEEAEIRNRMWDEIHKQPGYRGY